MTENGHKSNGVNDPEEQGRIRANGTPPVEYQFKPGQSGNPGGRPKGQSITAKLRAIVDADDGAVAIALAEAAKKAALEGDFRFWKELCDRIDGPIRQQLDQTIQRIAVEFEGRASMLEGEDED